MKKASKRRILFAARMATMVGAACFAASGISETLGQEKEKSRPVYITTEEMAETTYMPEVEETTQPTETAKAVETEEKIELPCKIGDTVYVFLFDKIIKCEVNTIVIDENNDVYVKFGKCDNGVCPAKIYSWEFGRMAFLSEEEAKEKQKSKK